MKTVAAILVEQRKPLEIAEVEIPPLRYGQVLVEIKVTRICGSQLGEIDGVKGPDRYLPHLMGHEAGGIVREVGPEVKRVKAGDHVVAHWRPGLGIEAGSSQYREQSRVINAGNITTFQQYAVVSENRVTKIDSDVSFDLAALLADTLTTGFGVITRDAKVKVAESVVVIGCGGIGLGVVLGAKLAGAYPIVAVDIHESKLQVARKNGATHEVSSRNADWEKSISAIVGEKGADVVIDGTGRPEIVEKALELTHPKGRTILFGVMPFDKKIQINTLPLHFGKVLTGSEGGQSRPCEDIPRYIRMHKAGLFSTETFITHRYSLEKVNEAIAAMREGRSIHSVIDFK